MNSKALFQWIAGAALVLGLVLAAPAGAAIYKCIGVDGSTSFVSNPTDCVGKVQRHQLKKKFQRAAPSGGAAKERLARPAAMSGAAGAAGAPGEADVWRKKKTEAQAKLAEAEQAVRYLRNAAKGCNRGGNWYRNTESGIREAVPCSDIKDQLSQAEKAESDLRAYVNGGIEDECRRAGCLPGWLR